LKRYVVVELKAGEFKPEHAGKLNVYLAAVDRQIKASDDQPTIGLVLCKTKNRLVAEYALSGLTQPMGVAEPTRAGAARGARHEATDDRATGSGAECVRTG
jgi:hypothetical protein